MDLEKEEWITGKKIGRLRRVGGRKERMNWRRLTYVAMSSREKFHSCYCLNSGIQEGRLWGSPARHRRTTRRLACGQCREEEKLKGSGFHDLEKKREQLIHI